MKGRSMEKITNNDYEMILLIYKFTVMQRYHKVFIISVEMYRVIATGKLY